MNDPHNLRRFLQAQENTYPSALAEIRSGRKRSHWMWYIFLRSCATLFAQISPPGSVFERLLERYFHGAFDQRTLHLLERKSFGDSLS
ncbi:MAG: DUF1810 family protein [Cyanobacteria bacterium RI_101]|nr:DUF1810 family protein [Cyanobacteria bacterium RI_101]